MPTIGRITVPTVSASGTFPLTPDTGYGYAIEPRVAVHSFLISGSVSAKREQRYKLGDGVRRYIVRKGRICKADLDSFAAFWLARGGAYQPFTFPAPNISGAGTSNVTVRFENTPLNYEHALALVASCGIVLVEVPSSVPTYTVSSTVSRFPSGGLESSLADQVQELIPLIRIRVRESAVPDIYLSNRAITVGGNTYEPRMLSWSGITQELGGASDDATFVFGNADRVFSAVAEDTQLRRATIEFSLFHVATTTMINLWSGEVKEFTGNQEGQFQVRCGDPIYEITLPYPVNQLSRTCWKPFNDGINCPWASAGSGGNPSYCDKTFSGADGCQSHGMANYFGGQAPEVQAAVIKDNGTGSLRFGRSSLTATSITNQSNFGRALQEIYTDVPFETSAMIVSGREESDFYTALGVVGAGPLGAYAREAGDLPRHTLDGQWNHGRESYLKNASKYSERFYGLRESLGVTPSTEAFAVQNTTGAPPPQRAAGTAFIEIRRSDPKGIQLSRPADHEMKAWVSLGLSGWTWTTPSTPVWSVLTNPIWICVNAVLRARGYRLNAASSSSAVNAAGGSLVDLDSAIAAAAVCDTSVVSLVDGSTETQFKFIGVLSDEKPLKEWLTEILNTCLGYFTFNFGKIRFGIRNNSISVNAFSEGNIVAGSLDLSSHDPNFNHITLQFANKDLQWSGDTITIYDADHAAEAGGAAAPLYLKSQLNLVGSSTRSQSLRIGATRLREETGGVTAAERRRARGGRWKTTVLALSTEPGQIVSVTHPDVPTGFGEFRITRWRLNEDFSIDIEARPTTDSMYDLTMGTVGVDVAPSAVPGSPIIVTAPGDIIPIGGDAFTASAPTLVVDSQGVQRYQIDLTYNPPTFIGPFNGVTVYQERGGEILPVGDYQYNGDNSDTAPGRYGTARILVDPPAGASPETIYLYVLAKSSTYRLPVIPRTEAVPSPNMPVILDPVDLIAGTPPDAVTITAASYEYLDAYRVRVKIYWDPPAVPGYFAGVHCWEEDPDVSSAPPTPMDGTQAMDATTNLSGEWAPIDRGRGVASPFVFEVTGPAATVTKRFYLASYSTGAEAALVRATEPSPTPSITLAIAPASYQSGVEYAQLVTGAVASIEYDDTQVASPKYRLRFQCAAPTIAPAAWQRGFGGYQIVYEYEDGSRANGPSFAVNELDSKSDWYDLYVGSSIVRCWFVSYDNSEQPRLNSIVAGVTPLSEVTVVWPLASRPPEALYADNVTAFSVANARYVTNGQGQKVLLIDWSWTPPATAEALARWGGSTIYLLITGDPQPYQITGAEQGAAGTMEFGQFPSAPTVWTFYAISSDNNGNANTTAAAPISGTPTAAITVNPPTAGAAGTEYTANVTSPSFAVAGIPASDGTTPQRITATFTRPAEVTWGGVEMRVYDGATLVAKVSGAASPIAVTIPNPTTSTTYTVKLVSFDVNGQTNTETAGTPKGTVLAGSTAGTLDLRKFLPASTDNFTIVGSYLQVKTGVAITVDGSGNLRVSPSGITSSLIAAGAVDNAALFNGAVDDLKLAAGAVTAAKIAAGAVGTSAIATSAITSTQIATDAVTTPKILAGSVTTAKVAAGAITANEIAALTITAGNIATDAITAAKILAGSITTIKIAAGAVTATEIAAGAIITAKLAAGAVTANEIATDAVTATKILAGAVTAGKIAANSISSDKLDATVINVGGGGSKPGKFAVFNAAGSQIGFIGVEAGDEGAWFKTCRIGGSSYGTGIFRADAAGNVVIDGATFTLNLNSAITDVGNLSVGGYTAGLRVRATSGSTAFHVAKDRIFSYDASGNLLVDVISYLGAGALGLYEAGSSRVEIFGGTLFGPTTCDLKSGGGGAEYRVSGTRVVNSRKTGWSAPTGTATRSSFATGSVSTSQLAEAVKALIDDLTSHGLIGA